MKTPITLVWLLLIGMMACEDQLLDFNERSEPIPVEVIRDLPGKLTATFFQTFVPDSSLRRETSSLELALTNISGALLQDLEILLQIYRTEEQAYPGLAYQERISLSQLTPGQETSRQPLNVDFPLRLDTPLIAMELIRADGIYSHPLANVYQGQYWVEGIVNGDSVPVAIGTVAGFLNHEGSFRFQKSAGLGLRELSGQLDETGQLSATATLDAEGAGEMPSFSFTEISLNSREVRGDSLQLSFSMAQASNQLDSAHSVQLLLFPL